MLKPHECNKGFQAVARASYQKGASIRIKSRLRSEALIKVHRESSLATVRRSESHTAALGGPVPFVVARPSPKDLFGNNARCSDILD